MEDFLITVFEASNLTEFPLGKWFQWIFRGLIPSYPELKEENIKGISYSNLSNQVLIPVSYLPKYYSTEIIKSRVLKDKIISVDFIGFLEQNGEEKLHKILNGITLLKNFITSKQSNIHSKTQNALVFSEDCGISLATLYRKESLFMKSDLKKLLHTSTKIYHPQKMCYLSEDFAKYE